MGKAFLEKRLPMKTVLKPTQVDRWSTLRPEIPVLKELGKLTP